MLAERYEAGDHEAVWSELIGLGARVREPGHLEDAERVVELTMKLESLRSGLLPI